MTLVRFPAVACLTAILLFSTVTAASARLLSGVSFYADNTQVVFRPQLASQKNVPATRAITFTVASSREEWTASYQALPLVGQVDTFPSSQILIKTPFTDGFVPADQPRMLAKGGLIHLPGDEVGSISLMLVLSGRELSDEYSGIMVSPEGAPPLKLRLFTKPLRNEPPPVPTPDAPIEINPGLLELTLSPGQSTTTDLYITNNQNDAISVTLRATDLHLDMEGKETYEPAPKSLPPAADWLTTDPPSLEILSWSTGKMSVTLTAPATFTGTRQLAMQVTPQDISATQNAPPPPAISKLLITRPGLATVYRSRIALLERGQDASNKDQYRVRVHNTGNAYLTVQSATISMMHQEETIARFPLTPFSTLIFPASTREFTAFWPGSERLTPGFYTVETTVHFLKGSPAKESIIVDLREDSTPLRPQVPQPIALPDATAN